ncbi:MAG: adenylate/guanylate cyclase domain-containing protein [Rhodospirillaceae bacterium]|jgi:adenylate cyclase|nr:adenylate/guanylate cyclase domain-containing protein [Rhodospirillaceae bacterium]MBT5192704.1 adenylate/guanylate cyclase domain-containing protein [Rhodospirillaceae bacterium]MBT5895438.1 adenylate/guanylate cyclase domain-containing protein [Rhodospirillaceae bacterium]MBT6431267.1 adenylate/guanylate cyclase domain-containing protein [Rhodospirillaceae bacterium]
MAEVIRMDNLSQMIPGALPQEKLGDVLRDLETGVAIVALADWRITFENGRFFQWCPPKDDADAPLSDRLDDFKADRARDRLQKNRPYRQSFEVREGARSTFLEITMRSFDGGSDYAVVECRDMTAQKRAEYMLESYSEVSERNTRELQKEKDRVEKLLLNIMPRSVYEEMKDYGTVTPQRYENATIMLLDFVDFTEMAISREPGELVAELNDIFSAFDRIVEMFGCERIKTMGDAYMAVSGLPESSPEHAADMARVALRIRRYLGRRNAAHRQTWNCRIGIATGPVIGSIVGIQKYVYDIFGPGVNMAARMESFSEPMRITMSSETYDLIADDFIVEDRGFHEVKGFGNTELFFLEGEKERTTIRRETRL